MNCLIFPTCVSVHDASIPWTFPAVCCWLIQVLLLELISELTPAGSAFPSLFVSVKDSPMCFHSTPDYLLYSSTNLFICLAWNFMNPVNKQGALYRCRIYPLSSGTFFMEDVFGQLQLQVCKEMHFVEDFHSLRQKLSRCVSMHSKYDFDPRHPPRR